MTDAGLDHLKGLTKLQRLYLSNTSVNGAGLVHVKGTCEGMLAERKASLAAVIDRYDYVLMIDPPDYGRDLIAPHLKLQSHIGSAWLYAVVPSTQQSAAGNAGR